MAGARGRFETDALSQLRPERESREDRISPRDLGPRGVNGLAQDHSRRAEEESLPRKRSYWDWCCLGRLLGGVGQKHRDWWRGALVSPRELNTE